MAQKILHGIGVSEGIRVAKAFVFRQPKADFGRDISADAAKAETERLEKAVKDASADVERLIENASGVIEKSKLGVLKGQRSMLADPAYVPEMKKLISQRHYSAEKSVHKITDKFDTLFSNMPNPYLKERAGDVRDAGNRLIRFLSGMGGQNLDGICEKVVLLAQELSAADTVRLNSDYTIGFATETGGPTAHTAIFAKSMEIPAVVGVTDLLKDIRSGDLVILDGTQGLLVIDPDEATLARYREKAKKEEARREIFKAFSHEPARLASGKRTIVAANIGLAADAEFSLKQGAEAAGLMRTETIFLSRSSMPSEEEQFYEYKKAAQSFACADPGEVIIRTLDIGGDKAEDYLHIKKEQNPFLGFRAIRLCLDRRELFMTQLRAILRASYFGKIKIMFPMVSGVAELRTAKSLLLEAEEQLDGEGIAYDPEIKTGIMVEVPSAAIMADTLAGESDFFSIGTNDLTQYTLAVDRGNPSVSYLYDPFDPAVLRLIRMTVQAAGSHRIPVGMCGGMAGDPLAVPLLIGLGLDELSMAPGVIPKTKYIISKLEIDDCKGFAQKALALPGAEEIRAASAEFIKRFDLL